MINLTAGMLLASEGKLMLCARCSQAWSILCRQGYAAAASAQKTPSKNHYETLGVSKTADAKEIKDAFIALSKTVHPDGNPSDPLRHDQFVKLNEAYMVLSNPIKKREYDAVKSYKGIYQNSPHDVYTHSGYYEDRLRRKQRMYQEEQEQGMFSSRHVTALAMMGAVFFIGSAMLSGKARHDVKVRSVKIHQEFSQSQHKNREIRRLMKLRDVLQNRRTQKEIQDKAHETKSS